MAPRSTRIDGQRSRTSNRNGTRKRRAIARPLRLTRRCGEVDHDVRAASHSEPDRRRPGGEAQHAPSSLPIVAAVAARVEPAKADAAVILGGPAAGARPREVVEPGGDDGHLMAATDQLCTQVAVPGDAWRAGRQTVLIDDEKVHRLRMVARLRRPGFPGGSPSGGGQIGCCLTGYASGRHATPRYETCRPASPRRRSWTRASNSAMTRRSTNSCCSASRRPTRTSTRSASDLEPASDRTPSSTTGMTIGRRFQTGHGVLVRESNRIGSDVSVGTHSIDRAPRGARRRRARIHSNAFIPEFSVVEAGAWVGPSVTFTNARYPLGRDTKANLRGPVIGRGRRSGPTRRSFPAS